MDKQQTDFLSLVYSLPVSRVWRGHGNVMFIELGALDDKKGEYTLWVETNLWKMVEDDVVFDGNEEPYEAIDSKVQILMNKKITGVELDKNLEVSFGDIKLVCSPKDRFVSIIDNKKKLYLNYEVDGSISINDGKS